MAETGKGQGGAGRHCGDVSQGDAEGLPSAGDLWLLVPEVGVAQAGQRGRGRRGTPGTEAERSLREGLGQRDRDVGTELRDPCSGTRPGIPSWQAGSVESATVHCGCPRQADGEAPGPHISALPVLHPRGRCWAWAPLVPRSGATVPTPMLLLSQAPASASICRPDSGPPVQPQPAALRWATLDGYRPAAAALPPGERREGPAPPGGISFLSRALSQAPPQRAPFTSRAFEEIWRTPSHPGQTRLKGSRAGRSVGTPGQPAGQNTGAAAHRRTGDCRKGAAWLQGPRGGNGTDTGQELKDLLLAQELGTPVPRTLTHSCVATALGRQGPGTASHCDAGRAPSCATSPSAPASSSLKWG